MEPAATESEVRVQSRPEASTRIVDFAVCLIPVAVCLLLYRKIARLWWMWDDPYHLNLIQPATFRQIFFSSTLWHGHPSHVYTPMLLASLKADLVAFGVNPRGFYLHQLAAISIAAVVVYFALRQLLDPIAAGATTLLALVGPAFADTVPQVMTRHYFEGLIFAAASFIAFARKRPIPSAILYFISTLAKEVFVPLPLLLIAIDRRRWRDLVPHAIAAVAYACLRFAMLGPHLEAYGYTVRASRWPAEIATAPLRVARVFAGHAGIAGISLAAAVLLCVVLLFIRDANRRLAIVAGAIAAIVPILPVSIDMQPRYVLMAWLLASIAAGLLLKRYAAVILLIALIANRVEWTQTMRTSQRMSDEARVFSLLSPADLLYMPLTPPATLMELRTLTHSNGRWLYDQQPLCAKRVSANRILSYDAGARMVRDLDPAALAQQCASIRTAPLSVTLDGERDRLFWNFGPYRDGTYRVVVADGLQAFDVLPDVGFRLPGATALPLRVRYESPAGWATYSPDLTIDIARSQKLQWHR